jgi:hypothetical protein
MSAHESALDEYCSQLIGSEAGKPERALWAAALDLLIKDGQAHWQGRGSTAGEVYELEAAFDDLCRCGPMTRHCCRWLDLDPRWISEGFVSWCDTA